MDQQQEPDNPLNSPPSQPETQPKGDDPNVEVAFNEKTLAKLNEALGLPAEQPFETESIKAFQGWLRADVTGVLNEDTVVKLQRRLDLEPTGKWDDNLTNDLSKYLGT